MKFSRAQSIVFGTAFVLIAGCQPDPEDVTAEDAPSNRAQTDGVAANATGSADQEAPELPDWPASGQSAVEVTDGRIIIVSNDAPQLIVLERLADVLGFRIELGEAVSGSISGTLVDDDVHRAVSFVLNGLPFTTHYTIDAENGNHKLAAIRIGRFVGVDSPAAVQTSIDVPQDTRAAVDRWRQENPNLSLQLADSDPEVRASALESLDPESDDITILADVVVNDPEAPVRVAAIEQLYFDDSNEVKQISVNALQDSDPTVVIAALDLVEAWQDPSLMTHIDMLRQHPNIEVRERATEIIALFDESGD